jgi:uncharacterized protein
MFAHGMPAQETLAQEPTGQEPSSGRVDLDALDAFLRSERAPHSMLLSQLDGFLTGIAVGPDLVMPREWMPVVWGGEAPQFADLDEAQAIVGTIVARYAEIQRDISRRDPDPIFWVGPEGETIASDWARGFVRAMALRREAWGSLIRSKQGDRLLFPILALYGDADANPLIAVARDIGLVGESDRQLLEDLAALVPVSIVALDVHWRRQRTRQMSAPIMRRRAVMPAASSSKIGRNEPCPCGSGRKFKKCCASMDEDKPASTLLRS